MYSKRRPAPDTTYESQAARWKQGFKAPSQQPVPNQMDLENVLISELCSSVGSSSFPPREVLQKLLRYLHTLDHDYICELLDDRFESPLWQVKAKALSVLSALLGTGDANFYKQYYSDRLDLLEDLRNARKDMLRKRADKVYALLKHDVSSPNDESPLERMQRMQEEEDQENASEMKTFMHTSPVVQSQQTPPTLRMDGKESPRSSSAPLPSPVDEASAFHFLTPRVHPSQETYTPGPLAAEPRTPPIGNSAFGFLSADGGEDSVPSTPTPPASGNVGFTCMAASPVHECNSTTGATPNVAQPSAMPPTSTTCTLTHRKNQIHATHGTDVAQHGMPTSSTTETTSAFAFIGGHQQHQLQKAASATTPPRTAPTPELRRRHTVFDTLPEPMLLQPRPMSVQPEKEAANVETPVESDPIHDAFEGLDAYNGAQALDSFDAYKPSSEAVHGAIGSHVPSHSTERLREVILEIDVPPGPMGVMLDRTIPDMTVIERFVPLPTGGRGYLEMHPAICPGCALVSINSIYVENKGLVEVGPILASLANAPKLLRFKKLIKHGRTANPSTLEMPYIPPPLEEEESKTTDDQSVETKQLASESAPFPPPSSPDGDAYLTRLNVYNSDLNEIEAKLSDIIRREHSGEPIADRRNQLAQLHGTLEQIQTQGIDSVIFGERRPSNYEDVKQVRLTLVRRADELAKRIQRTASVEPEPVAALNEEKQSVSAFAFVQETAHGCPVMDPPLGISQLQGDASLQVKAKTCPPIADVPAGNALASPSAPDLANDSYGFSFLRENAPPLSQVRETAAPPAASSSLNAPPTVERATNVFAGLSIKAGPSVQAAPALDDTLTKSSHGRPMGLSDLEASLRSTASGRPAMGTRRPGPTSTITDSTQSSFGFLSTLRAPDDETVLDSSSTSTEPTSPIGFNFLGASNTSSTTPTVASSSISHAQSLLREPEASMFSFISN